MHPHVLERAPAVQVHIAEESRGVQAGVAIMEAAVQVQIVEESKGVQVGGAIREAALQVPKDDWLWVLAKNVAGIQPNKFSSRGTAISHHIWQTSSS